MVLFTATFSAVNGYGVEELAETYIGRPIARALGLEISTEPRLGRVSEPENQLWLYQSGKVGGAFATEIKGHHALLILNCEKRSSNPYLSLSMNLPDFIEDQKSMLDALEKEASQKGHVDMEFQIGPSLRYEIEMSPSNFNQSGQADTWNSGHKGDSTLPNAHALRELVKSMISRTSVIQIYSGAYDDYLPMQVSTHGLRYLAQETGSLDQCL